MSQTFHTYVASAQFEKLPGRALQRLQHIITEDQRLPKLFASQEPTNDGRDQTPARDALRNHAGKNFVDKCGVGEVEFAG